MSEIRQQLKTLQEECISLCEEHGWLGHETRNPSYRLLYSSVQSYEHGSGFAIVGMNPAGGGRDADTDDPHRPFCEARYSAYLDDEWGSKRGTSRLPPGATPLQRVIQALAMILSGSSPSEAMSAMSDTTKTPRQRIGAKASDLLRNTPSMNIIPFRASKLSDVPKEIRERGEDIG